MAEMLSATVIPVGDSIDKPHDEKPTSQAESAQFFRQLTPNALA
jgi:hypothetical protein